ncbi:MAG: polysaccharide biosynthesis/export family protein [Pseudomonadales bacterium]|nr:polysaccharide biosynthesis/export family protein [Pseudomonadales bacterium]
MSGLVGAAGASGVGATAASASTDASTSSGTSADGVGSAEPSLAGVAPSVPGITSIHNASPSIKDAQAAQHQAAQKKANSGSTSGQLVSAETDFQRFIRESVGVKLPLFGYGMFGGSPSTFAPVEHVPVTPDYTVGPGDEIVIRTWGQLDVDYHATVDRMGSIYIPKIGSLNVAGVKYQDLKETIKTAIERNYRNFELEVNLGQLRSIHVYVVGQARQPGSYTVSSMSTLINAEQEQLI